MQTQQQQQQQQQYFYVVQQLAPAHSAPVSTAVTNQPHYFVSEVLQAIGVSTVQATNICSNLQGSNNNVRVASFTLNGQAHVYLITQYTL